MRAVHRARRKLAGTGCLILSVLMVAGCAKPDKYTDTAHVPTDGYRTRHPIILTEGAEKIDLPIAQSQTRLTESHREIVQAFAEEAMGKGANIVEVYVPKGSANEHAAYRVSKDIRHAIASGGLRHGAVMRPYNAGDPSVSAPIRLVYSTIKAKVPNECGQWPGDLNTNADNTDYFNFGCATQTTLAAIVRDPTDLVTPRAAAPGDTLRRRQVLEKYRKGEPTKSEHAQQQQNIIQIGQ